MNKPKLLDLYCCAGGASYGYTQAGFDVVGVDIDPQPHYRGVFVQSDAIAYLREHWMEFDAIHASPPCQAYSRASEQFRSAGKRYVDLVSATRNELIKTGLPYIIENVPGSPLVNPVLLCGSMFGMRTYRHRLFESNIQLITPEHKKHIAKNAKMGRRPEGGEFIQYVWPFSGVGMVQDMIGMNWLNHTNLRKAFRLSTRNTLESS